MTVARSPGFTVAPPGPGHGAAGVPGRRCQQTQTKLREEPALPHPGTRETRPEDRGLCGRPSPRLPGPPGQWQPPPTGTRFPREQPIPRLQGADSLGPTRPAWQGHGRRGVPTFQSPPHGTDGPERPQGTAKGSSAGGGEGSKLFLTNKVNSEEKEQSLRQRW